MDNIKFILNCQTRFSDKYKNLKHKALKRSAKKKLKKRRLRRNSLCLYNWQNARGGIELNSLMPLFLFC